MKTLTRLLDDVKLWVDSEPKQPATLNPSAANSINWTRCLPFIALHLFCLVAFWTGISTTALVLCIASYLIRMFAITAFYHRYFSHRSFKTSRFFQCVFAILGCSASQRGPLWWAAHHRYHHKHSDTTDDLHSPSQHGFFWSHMGWFTSDKNFSTQHQHIRDFSRYPELRFLNRFDVLIPAILIGCLFIVGEALKHYSALSTVSGLQFVVWGFAIPTVLLFHATASINSLGHVFGKRRFTTEDNSRNNFLLALLTLGEGWHNNHHRWPTSARQGFFWWEIDITYYLLKGLSFLGVIWDLNPVPRKLKTTPGNS